MVTSTGSGLAVPDWPLSYGTLFPPMVGGVFYEHSHRMVAALVGALTLCLMIWLFVAEERRWVRYLGLAAFAMVVAQGILGGLTVLFFLPLPISLSHAVLAQTFFIFTILIAYSQSAERKLSESDPKQVTPKALKFSFLFVLLVYIQLILGAWMRHAGPDPAIPAPLFFIHLLGAVGIAVMAFCLNREGVRFYRNDHRTMFTFYLLDTLILAQWVLGLCAVLPQRIPTVTSFHVAMGAAVLGVSVLLLLRVAPPSFQETKRLLFNA